MAADKQQHAMTSLNNLALLLDEALQQMMQQMNAPEQARQRQLQKARWQRVAGKARSRAWPR
jgi:hypothetical protein